MLMLLLQQLSLQQFVVSSTAVFVVVTAVVVFEPVLEHVAVCLFVGWFVRWLLLLLQQLSLQ